MEGAATFASLVIGVAVTQQLLNLHFLLRERKRVRWDFLCLSVAILIQLTIIMVWWGIAGPSRSAITIGQFLPTFAILVLLFLLSAASLPDPADEDARDLRAYYDTNSSYIWGLFLMVTLLSSGLEVLNNAPNDRSFFNFLLSRFLDLLVLPLAMLSLIFFHARWWHWTVLAVLAVGPIGWLSRSLT